MNLETWCWCMFPSEKQVTFLINSFWSTKNWVQLFCNRRFFTCTLISLRIFSITIFWTANQLHLFSHNSNYRKTGQIFWYMPCCWWFDAILCGVCDISHHNRHFRNFKKISYFFLIFFFRKQKVKRSRAVWWWMFAALYYSSTSSHPLHVCSFGMMGSTPFVPNWMQRFLVCFCGVSSKKWQAWIAHIVNLNFCCSPSLRWCFSYCCFWYLFRLQLLIAFVFIHVIFPNTFLMWNIEFVATIGFNDCIVNVLKRVKQLCQWWHCIPCTPSLDTLLLDLGFPLCLCSVWCFLVKNGTNSTLYYSEHDFNPTCHLQLKDWVSAIFVEVLLLWAGTYCDCEDAISLSSYCALQSWLRCIAATSYSEDNDIVFWNTCLRNSVLQWGSSNARLNTKEHKSKTSKLYGFYFAHALLKPRFRQNTLGVIDKLLCFCAAYYVLESTPEMLRVNQMKLHDKIKIIVGFFPVKTNMVLRTSSWKMHAVQMLVFFYSQFWKFWRMKRQLGEKEGLKIWTV